MRPTATGMPRRVSSSGALERGGGGMSPALPAAAGHSQRGGGGRATAVAAAGAAVEDLLGRLKGVRIHRHLWTQSFPVLIAGGTGLALAGVVLEIVQVQQRRRRHASARAPAPRR